MTPLLGRPLTRLHLRRRRRPGRGRAARAAAAADRDHPARRAHRRHRPDPAARRVRHPPRHGHGPQPRRVRGARRRRRAVVRGSARGGQRARPGDGQPGRSTTAARWRPYGAARGDRADRRARSTATSSSPTSTARIRPSSAAPPRPSSRRSAAFEQAGHTRRPHPCQPRVPHLDRGAGQRAAAADAVAAEAARAPAPDRGQCRRRVLPDRRARRGGRDARHRSAARSPRRCSSSRACTRCTRPARASSSRSGRSRRCRASPRTCSARRTTTSSPCSPTIPKNGDLPSFNHALCGLYAAGLGYPAGDEPTAGTPEVSARAAAVTVPPQQPSISQAPSPRGQPCLLIATPNSATCWPTCSTRSRHILASATRLSAAAAAVAALSSARAAPTEPVVITGAALGLPGTDHVFDDENVARILSGQQFIDVIPRQSAARWSTSTSPGWSRASNGTRSSRRSRARPTSSSWRAGTAPFDVVEEFGIDPDRDAALDSCTRLAIGAGIDALRDAGIPLVRHYHTTTLGTQLPDRWGLPDELRDDTGVVFASAFPGYESFAHDLNCYHEDRARRTSWRRWRTCAAG